MSVLILYLIAGMCVSAILCASDGDGVRLTRLPAREVMEYRAYKDVSIFHYNIPENVRLATWNFNSSEHLLSPSVVSKCTPRAITVVLKFGSYPVINPDGSAFPKNFYIERKKHHTVNLSSDSIIKVLNISNPEPGDWFAVAFLSYTDPNDDKILQQGISPNCAALMESTVTVIRTTSLISITPGISLYQTLKTSKYDGNELFNTYKLHVPRESWMLSVNLTVTDCTTDAGAVQCPVLLLVASAFNLPSDEFPSEDARHTMVCDSLKRSDSCQLDMVAAEDTWHYVSVFSSNVVQKQSITVTFQLNVLIISGNHQSESVVFPNVTYPILNYSRDSFLSLSNHSLQKSFWNEVHLLRQSFPAFFAFNYIRDTYEDDVNIASLNISTSEPTLLKFNIHPIIDIAGTLTLDLVLKIPETLNVKKSMYNISVIACVSHGVRATPLFPNMCNDNFGTPTEAQILVNSTSALSGQVNIPYPENGLWYLTLMPYCYSSDAGVPKQEDCKEATGISVAFGVESYACSHDNCGKFGRCYNYMSGGLIFSTCVCAHGYSGWFCTDASTVSPLGELLLSALLLTLSNLLFLPSIVFALRRKYFTEALVYLFTMFFSTFYHACDAGGDIYSYCMLPLTVLQFCDFYSAILAMWVTLIAMSDLKSRWRSLFHMAGAVGIALGTEYNRTSLWVFLVPCVIGLAILTTQWVMQCRKIRSCYPNKRYWKLFFPPGMVLVIIGLNCYAFLQTRNNYKFVHSAWHGIMALSIIFLLPSKQYFTMNQVESDSSSDSSTSIWKRSQYYFSLKWCKTR